RNVTGVQTCALPIFMIFFFDRNVEAFSYLSTPERLMASFFQSTSARTAGFNTIDLNMMTHPTKMVMIMLMLIGGSSGSTAGGMRSEERRVGKVGRSR